MALIQITEPGEVVDPGQLKRAAGIDLGTTNSLIASVRAGLPETLADRDGNHMLPSVVRYLDEGIKVGEVAWSQAAADPNNTIVSVKRLMGRGLDDFATLGDQLPYEFATGANQVPKIVTRVGEVTPIQVSAEIIRALVGRARDALAGDLDGVVLTVPAYFDDGQRQATKDAAVLAGVNVLRLLNEPTAAAIAYGLDRGSEGVIAVYDLGGGTFDVSLLRLSKGVFEVLATGGDSALGGDDFDSAITRWILAESGYSVAPTPTQFRALMMQARAVKERLSDDKVTSIDVAQEGLVFDGEISRDEFDGLVEGATGAS